MVEFKSFSLRGDLSAKNWRSKRLNDAVSAGLDC
jgi:hypothetical protein